MTPEKSITSKKTETPEKVSEENRPVKVSSQTIPSIPRANTRNSKAASSLTHVELSLKERITNQIQTQIAKVNNGESFDDIKELREEKASERNYIQVANLAGKCLFTALYHQLDSNFRSDISQTKNVFLFRTNVVQHIKNNINVFMGDLEKRITESGRKFKNKQKIEKECNTFVDRLGTEYGIGGIETIRAVSMIHKVNIISLDYRGSSRVPCKLNPDYRSLLLIHQHEDQNSSIMFMSDDVIEKMSQTISNAVENE